MRKKSVLALVLFFLLSLVACTPNTTSGTESIDSSAKPEVLMNSIEQAYIAAESYTLITNAKSNDHTGKETVSLTSSFLCSDIGKETYRESTTTVLKAGGTTLTTGEGFQNGYMYKSANDAYTHSPIKLADYLSWVELQNGENSLEKLEYNECTVQKIELTDDVWTLVIDDIGAKNSELFIQAMGLNELLGIDIGIPDIGMTVETDSKYNETKIHFEFSFESPDISSVYVNIEIKDLNKTAVDTLDFKKLNSIESVDFRVIESISALFTQLSTAQNVELTRTYTENENVISENQSNTYTESDTIKLSRRNGFYYEVNSKRDGETIRKKYADGYLNIYYGSNSSPQTEKMTAAQAENHLFELIDPYKFSLNHVLEIKKVSNLCFEFELPKTLMQHLTSGLRVSKSSAVMKVTLDDSYNVVSYEYIFIVEGYAEQTGLRIQDNQKFTVNNLT